MDLPLARHWRAVTLVLSSIAVGGGVAIWWSEPGEPNARKTASVADPSVSWCRTVAWLEPNQIEQRVKEATRKELAEILAGGDGAEWMPGVNGAEILRAILVRLAKEGDPADAARNAFAWIARSNFTEATRLEVLGVVCEVVAADERLAPDVLAGLVKGRPTEEVRSVVDAFLRARVQASPADAESVARRFVLEAGIAPESAPLLSASASASVWFEKDPEAAIQFASTMKAMPMLSRGLRQALAINPERGMRLFQLMIDSGGDTHALGHTAFDAGFSAVRLREALAGKMEKLDDYLPSFAAKTFFEAPAEIPELARVFSASDVFAHWKRGHMRYSQGALAIANGLAERDLGAARAWLAPLSEEHRLLALRATWQFEGLGNPRFAELCVEEPAFFKDGNHNRTFFLALATARPDARARALELLPKEGRNQWDFEMRSFSIPMEFRGQVAGAMDAAGSAPEQLRERLRTLVFQGLMADYPEQAREWLEAHPDMKKELGGGYATMMPLLADADRGRIIAENHLRDPKSAIGWLTEASDFAAHLGEVDPARGSVWLNSLPEHARSRPALLLALNWSTYAPEEAAAWVRSLPPGVTRNAAAEGIAQSLRHDAEVALNWAKRIGDGEHQHAAIKKLVQDWSRADLETATWLAEQGAVTDAQRSELQALINREAMRRGDME